ncbi:PDZ domain-containing protein [Marinilabiliaceae bacterium JC017]|nr:PDZ domain-containing protein [Marinilabiliaceae bacterium JC017]
MRNLVRLVLLIAFSISISFNLPAQKYDRDIHKLQMAWQIITNFYVDTVNKASVTEDAIVGMLKNLDPHSVYISADEVKAMNEPLDGSFEGIGIEFNILQDTLMVVSPIPGGPSEKVGLKSGDRIVSIDGKNVAGVGLKNSEVFKLLRGKKGTKVNLQIRRRGNLDLLAFVVIRDKIPIYSVEAAYKANAQTGYIKISRFSSTTHDEFVAAIKKLKDEKAENLILDLRGNGGGYLKAAIEVADELIDNKKLLVYTEGMTSPRREHHARGMGLFEKGNLVVLIDDGSASASEIVAGAVQDWDRGIVLGRRSFGKGLVQRPFSLPDGAMMRLTIAKYYTPSGRCIQKDYADGNLAYQEEIFNRYLHGEMASPDSVSQVDSLKYNTMISGRTVYGGGGIMPDIFVPVDTTMYSDYYRDIVASGILNRFVLNYMDQNRPILVKNYKDYSSFEKRFKVTNELMSELIAKAEEEAIHKDEEALKLSGRLLRYQIKALIARDLWSSSEYYQAINPLMEVYEKALEVVEDKHIFSQVLK